MSLLTKILSRIYMKTIGKIANNVFIKIILSITNKNVIYFHNFTGSLKNTFSSNNELNTLSFILYNLRIIIFFRYIMIPLEFKNFIYKPFILSFRSPFPFYMYRNIYSSGYHIWSWLCFA